MAEHHGHSHADHPPLKDSEAAIRIANLGYSYEKTSVLEDITFDVKFGTVVGIIGPNGGGKSTLLKILLGSLGDYSGKAEVLGKPARDHRRGSCCIGYVPQRHEMALNFPVLVREVVEMGLYSREKIFRAITSAEKNSVTEILEKVGMKEFADSPISALSGGQQQRAFIARALVSRPKLLFLDEPTTGIDPGGQMKFMELIAELKKELELTIMMVSHDLRVVAGAADVVICLNKFLHCHSNPTDISRETLLKTYSCDYDVLLNMH